VITPPGAYTPDLETAVGVGHSGGGATTWAVRLCPFIVVQRHRRLHGDLAGGGELPPGSHGEKPPYWVLGITRTYRAVPLPGSMSASGFTAYLPAPFRTVHTYTYGADGRISPVPTTRDG
jgi:hypothetical protein